MNAQETSSVVRPGVPVTLASPEQIQKEKLAVRLLNSDVMVAARRDIETLYRNDPLSADASARATIERAAHSLAHAAAQYAANEDTERPVVMWTTSGPHSWFGVDVPRSGYAIDNPDNVYRGVSIDGAARYVIHGQVHHPEPVQQTFVLYSALPGVASRKHMNAEGHMIELASLRLDALEIAKDGSFTITIDSDPAGDRPNHATSDAANPDMFMLIRDTLADWSRENPVKLHIERIGEPPLHAPLSEAELALRAAYILGELGPFWQNWLTKRVYAIPVNHVPTPWARAGGWGFAQYGHFQFAEDEAWVVTVDRLAARYVALQLADPWGVSLDYEQHSSSLNQSQAQGNADGTYSFIVSARDPGAFNWIDSCGLLAGTFTFRWQGLPADHPPIDRVIRSSEIVPLDRLTDALLPETRWVTREERDAQREARLTSYRRRVAHP